MLTSRRRYLVKFRFLINYKGNSRGDSFYKYYMPRWSAFLKQCMQVTLPRSMIRDLPELRRVTPYNLQVESISDILIAKNPNLARSLIEAAPLFNSSPHDLKVHILATFGITSSEYSEEAKWSDVPTI